MGGYRDHSGRCMSLKALCLRRKRPRVVRISGNLAQASICGTRAAESSRISHSISGRRCSKGTRGPGPVADFRAFLKNPRVLRAFADEVRDGTRAKGVFFSVTRGAQPILRLEGRVK